MSRLSNADVLAMADVPDWWIPSAPEPCSMRTLRQAVGEAMAARRTGQMSLFRPGGFGAQAIWLDADEIERIDTLLRTQSVAA